MIKTKFAALIAVIAISGCAKSPDAIAPVSMGNAFANLPCTQAAKTLNSEKELLAALEEQQKGAVAGDAVGVFLLGVPVSSLTGGDKEGDIATSKGKIVALENRLLSC